MKKEEQIILDYLNKYVPFLEDIYNTDEKRRWCASYNVYQEVSSDNWNLSMHLSEFMEKAYDAGLVPSNYSTTYDTIGNDGLYAKITTPDILATLSNKQLISLIAKEFRHDHFCEGCLINHYIADGIMLFYLEELQKRFQAKKV